MSTKEFTMESTSSSWILRFFFGIQIILGLGSVVVGVVGNIILQEIEADDTYSLGIWCGVAAIISGSCSLLGTRRRSDTVEHAIGLVLNSVGVIFSIYMVCHTANRLKVVSDARNDNTLIVDAGEDDDAESLLIVLLVFGACMLFLLTASMLWFAVQIYGYHFSTREGSELDYPPRYRDDYYHHKAPSRGRAVDLYYSNPRRY